MQKVKNGIKALFLAILSVVLIFGIAAMSACNGGETSDGENNNVSGSEENNGSDEENSDGSGDSSGDNTGDNASDSTGDNTDNNNDGDKSDEEESNLISGEYIVDVSWTGGMHNYMTLIVCIDAENMTFNQYYASDSTASKGSGSITLENSVYTMTYSDVTVDGVNTTTFTFDEDSGEITFTSALLWGTRSFDSSSTSADGSFATYKAQPIVVSGEYIVDLSWTGGMQNYMTLIVNIDMSTMSFSQYYASGSGTTLTGSVVYADGVYSMTYADVEVDGVSTTTFTYDGTITFTSAVLASSRMFANTDTDGNFVPYGAEIIVASGEYNVDLEWTGGMAAYVTAIVNIDMSTMSFNLYYESSPDTSKGTGKVIYSDGVYTMSYSEAVNEVSETTFTYDYTTKTITFTSALLWGSSSFDSSSTTDDGSFAPYTAAFVESSDAEQTVTIYENYTDYINTDSTTYTVSESVVTYSIVTKANSPAGAFTITAVVGSDKTVTSFTIETNGSTGGYESNMFDTSTLVGKTESQLSALLSSDSGTTITTGATKSNTLCVYAALFAVGNYDICVANV